MPSPKKQAPEPVPAPEEREITIMAVWCSDCKTLIEGPSGQVGETLWFDHNAHETETVDSWEETIEVDN